MKKPDGYTPPGRFLCHHVTIELFCPSRAAARRAPAIGPPPPAIPAPARRIPPPRHAPSPRLPRKAAVYRPRPAARQHARPAPSRPPRGLCGPHAAKPRLRPVGGPPPGRNAPASRAESARRAARHSARSPPSRRKPARVRPAEAHHRLFAAPAWPRHSRRTAPPRSAVPPRGNRILGLFQLETAAPSRVNFRKIQGWGY